MISITVQFLLKATSIAEFNSRYEKITGISSKVNSESRLLIIKEKVKAEIEKGEDVNLSTVKDIISNLEKENRNIRSLTTSSNKILTNDFPIFRFREKELVQVYSFFKSPRKRCLVIEGPKQSGRKSLIKEFIRRSVISVYPDIDYTFSEITYKSPKTRNEKICGISFKDVPSVEPLDVMYNFSKIVVISNTDIPQVSHSNNQKPLSATPDPQVVETITLEPYTWDQACIIFESIYSMILNDYESISLSEGGTERIKYIARSMHNPLKAMIELLEESLSLRLYYNYYSPSEYLDMPPNTEGYSRIVEVGMVDKACESLFGSLVSKDRLNLLSNEISNRLAGLETQKKEIVLTIENALMCRKVNRPVCVLFFTGPAGVGKTKMARIISENLYGEGHLFKFDMSEYMTEQDSAKLLGAPPGYVGYGRSDMKEKINKPRGVVLLDEIEKANPAVHNIFLQVMEDGRVTTSKGESIIFDEMIIIITSNVLTRDKGVGFAIDHAADEIKLRSGLSDSLPKPFISRITKVILFPALSNDEVRIAVPMIFEDISRSMLMPVKFVDLTEGLLDEIIKHYNPSDGLRSIRSYIESELASFIDKTPSESSNAIAREKNSIETTDVESSEYEIF